jgi:protein-S-isoprenylcysteine O-methyltransferase Ste14
MASERGPGVVLPPPLLFAGGFAAAWVLDRVLLFEIDGDGAGRTQLLIASVLLLAGLGLGAWGVVTLVRSRTPVIPRRPARRLVRTGPYRFTRNPIYVGMIAVYAGLALALNAAWPLVVLPLLLVALGHQVIRREERHLAQAFGDAYAAYRRQVRRWM